MSQSSAHSGEDSVHSKISTSFNHDTVKEILKSQFSNSKNKITDDTVELMCELAKALVVETSLRASKQAFLQNKTTVTLDNVELILPQLMLDFP